MIKIILLFMFPVLFLYASNPSPAPQEVPYQDLRIAITFDDGGNINEVFNYYLGSEGQIVRHGEYFKFNKKHRTLVYGFYKHGEYMSGFQRIDYESKGGTDFSALMPTDKDRDFYSSYDQFAEDSEEVLDTEK